MNPSTDVLVVGGGVIGLAIARQVALAGRSVRLLEKGEPGGEASTAAAGILGPQVDAEGPGPLLEIGLRSRDLYPAFAADLREEAGVDPGLLDRGALRVAGDDSALERQWSFQRSAGLSVERLDRSALLRLEPRLGPSSGAALFFPRDGSVDNVALVRALRLAVVRAGVDLRPASPVERLVLSRGAVVGAESAGDRFAAGAVVVAAGAWSGGIRGEEVPVLPTHPVKGQIVCFGPGPAAIAHVVMGEDGYLVPRRDGRILAGSTMEMAGFDKRVTAGGVADLTAAALRLVPGLRDAPFHSAWAGLRPATGDDLPAIGPGTVPGLWYACGHLRNGILLAPITARAVARMILGDSPEPGVEAFDPRRFFLAPDLREGSRSAARPSP